MRFRVYGPMYRPGVLDPCACGLAYTTYKVHRETKQHKDALKKWRHESRERRRQERRAA